MRQRQPATIQVIRTDASRVELRSPRVVGDSLVGLAVGTKANASDSPGLVIALSQVEQVAVRHLDPIRTLVLIGAILLAIVGILFGVAFGQALSMWYDELADTED